MSLNVPIQFFEKHVIANLKKGKTHWLCPLFSNFISGRTTAFAKLRTPVLIPTLKKKKVCEPKSLLKWGAYTAYLKDLDHSYQFTFSIQGKMTAQSNKVFCGAQRISNTISNNIL